MIYLTLHDKLWIKIETADISVLDLIKDKFSYYVDGYFFMKKYKSGVWDGKIHIFQRNGRLLPIGLLFDLIKLLKKSKYEIKASDEVKSLYGQIVEDIDFNCGLKLTPRYYQDEIIRECIRHKKGLFISPTASGKSFIISCIINSLQRQNLISRALIIVPTTNLIEQFYTDMIGYGMDQNLLGKFYAEEKNWDKEILISTWQSLAYDNEKMRKNEISKIRKELKKKSIEEIEKEKLSIRLNKITSKDYIDRVNDLMDTRKNLMLTQDCFIVDECQSVKSTEVSNLMKKIKNAEYRYGCTGTMPDSQLDMINIKSYIGPILKRYTVKELTDSGFLNPCSIDIYNLYYSEKATGKLNAVKEEIFNKPFRRKIINKLIERIGSKNALILVGLVEKEGKVLEQQLKEAFPHKKIKFIFSEVKIKERERWRLKCINEDNVIIIAIYSLFQQGVNIPNLSYIIFGSSYKAKIRTLQSIGRSLRKSKNKEVSKIIDIVDHSNKFLPKQADERIKYYNKEEFEINKFDLHEGEER